MITLITHEGFVKQIPEPQWRGNVYKLASTVERHRPYSMDDVFDLSGARYFVRVFERQGHTNVFQER